MIYFLFSFPKQLLLFYRYDLLVFCIIYWNLKSMKVNIFIFLFLMYSLRLISMHRHLKYVWHNLLNIYISRYRYLSISYKLFYKFYASQSKLLPNHQLFSMNLGFCAQASILSLSYSECLVGIFVWVPCVCSKERGQKRVSYPL